MPDTSIGRLVTSRDEAIEEIRVQAKNGVDCIKIALDGIQRRPDGELIAAFTQDETTPWCARATGWAARWSCTRVGREATLYAARAGVDLIFHAFYLDDECIDACSRAASAIGPTLTFPRNIIDFTQPHEPAALNGRIGRRAARVRARPARNLRKAHKAGVPMMTGTDIGLCGHALRRMACARSSRSSSTTSASARPRRCCAATRTNAGFLADGEPARRARARPLRRFHRGRRLAARRHLDPAGQEPDPAVHLGGKRMALPERGYDPREVTDRALVNWNDVYTQARVAELRRDKPLRRAAE